MTKFNKLSFITLINLILFIQNTEGNMEGELGDYNILQQTAELESNKNSNENNDPLLKNAIEHSRGKTLHRVKRKGIGSFFGAKPKITPIDYGYSGSVYGPSGGILNPSGTHLGSNYPNDPAANLYYLIVSCISFGVLMYCCYQCRPRNQELLNEYRFRQLARQQESQRHRPNNSLNSVNDDSFLNSINGHQQLSNQNDAHSNSFKPTAPLAPVVEANLSNDTRNFNENNRRNQYDLPSYPNYSEQPPPTYEEAVKLDKTKHQSTN